MWSTEQVLLAHDFAVEQQIRVSILCLAWYGMRKSVAAWELKADSARPADLTTRQFAKASKANGEPDEAAQEEYSFLKKSVGDCDSDLVWGSQTALAQKGLAFALFPKGLLPKAALGEAVGIGDVSTTYPRSVSAWLIANPV